MMLLSWVSPDSERISTAVSLLDCKFPPLALPFSRGLIPIKAFLPSCEVSMQLMLVEIDNSVLAIRTPLRVKVLRVCCNSFQVMITPSEERQTEWATTPSSLRNKRPVLIEWKRTSDVSEQETTIPRSELTQQLSISLWCPWSTCIGPSIRRLRFFSIKWDEELFLDDGVPGPVEDSDMKLELDGSSLWNLQSNMVVSRDPVTR